MSPVVDDVDVLDWSDHGPQDYSHTLAAMQTFNAARSDKTRDQLWMLEHRSVYTLGISGGRQHLRDAMDIPVVPTDRGGQVTWHGPGQLVAYPLLDLRRRGLGMGALIHLLEQAVIGTVAGWGVVATTRRDAPGVYVADRKLASVGMRLRRGCTYHGIALNVGNDLGPFARIDPCGHPGLRMTRLADLGGPVEPGAVAAILAREICLALHHGIRARQAETQSG